MYTNSDVRAKAWTLTKGNFGKLFGITLLAIGVPTVLMMVVMTPIFISDNGIASLGGMLLMYLLMLLILPPISMGFARMGLGLWRSGFLYFKDIFYYLTDLKRYGKSLLFMIVLGFATGVVMFIPIIGFFIAIWVQFRLSLATWLFVSDERLNVIECIKFSFELMKGHCWRYFCMTFFLGLIWTGIVLVLMVPIMAIGAIIDSIFIVLLPLPLILLGYALFMPYFMLSLTGFSAELLPTHTPPAAPVNPVAPVTPIMPDNNDTYTGPEL